MEFDSFQRVISEKKIQFLGINYRKQPRGIDSVGSYYRNILFVRITLLAKLVLLDN